MPGLDDTDEAKGRTTSMPETSYRLPEWLGGHAVRVVQHDLAGFSQPHVLVAIQGGDYDGLPLALPSEQLVEVKPPPINTSNDHLVGSQADKITILIPPVAPMDVDEALRLAAWIVCITGIHDLAADERFARVLEAVRNT